MICFVFYIKSINFLRQINNCLNPVVLACVTQFSRSDYILGRISLVAQRPIVINLFRPFSDSTITHLRNALEHISSWMTANLLTLNSSKTEFLLIGNRQQLSKIQNTSLNTAHSVRNLGLIFDEHLTLSDYISALSKSCYSHIRHVSVLIRPPDIICRRTYILPVFLLSFFRPLIYEVLNGTQRKSTTWSEACFWGWGNSPKT